VVKAPETVSQQLPDKLDFVAFFLDDGTVGGEAEEVRLFCSAFQDHMTTIGPKLSMNKCEVVPPSNAAHTFGQKLFGGWSWKMDGNFKLLGAPLGNAAFCDDHASKRAAKAKELLEEIGAYPHKQGALQLLRHCGSWCKSFVLKPHRTA